MTTGQIIAIGETTSDSLAIDAATILHASFTEFYGLFTPPGHELFANMITQMFKPGTELSDTHVLMEGETVSGAFSWYPAEQAAMRQMNSLKLLLALPDTPKDLMPNLASFRDSVPAGDLEGAYLARIAVSKARRGKGLGGNLLQDFETKALDAGFTKTCLHVHRDNENAIAFYEAAGYAIPERTDASYFVMTKTIG